MNQELPPLQDIDFKLLSVKIREKYNKLPVGARVQLDYNLKAVLLQIENAVTKYAEATK